MESKDIIKQYEKLRKLIKSSQKSKGYTLMNAGTFNDNPQEITVSPWLLACTCEQQRCQCNARFKPYILCVKELPHKNDPPSNPSDNMTIQFIDFTYCNDRFPQETIENKNHKYQPFLDDIINLEWKVDPLIVVTAEARGTTHTPLIKLLNKISITRNYH